MAVGLGERTGGCLRCQEIENEETKAKESLDFSTKPSVYDTNIAQNETCKSNLFHHQSALSQSRQRS